MPLVDLTMQNRSGRSILEKLKPSERAVAWAALNPPLATECSSWIADPKRPKRFTVDTVREVLEYCHDQVLVDVIFTHDNRSSVESTALSALHRLRRISENPDLDVRPTVTVYETYEQSVAPVRELLARNSRYNGPGASHIRRALAALTDTELDEMYQEFPSVLIHEAIRRDRWDLVAQTPVLRGSHHAALVAEVIGTSSRVEPGAARTAFTLKAYPPKLASLPWSPAAIEFALASGDPVLMAFSGHLEPGQVDAASITPAQAAFVVNVTHDPRLVRWLWPQVIASPDIEWSHLRDFANDDSFSLEERAALATKIAPQMFDSVVFEPEHAPVLVAYALKHVGADWVFSVMATMSRSTPTPWQHAFVSEVLNTVPGALAALMRTHHGGFGLQLAINRLAEVFETTDDWKSFFSVTAGGFPGTLDELVEVVSLCASDTI